MRQPLLCLPLVCPSSDTVCRNEECYEKCMLSIVGEREFRLVKLRIKIEKESRIEKQKINQEVKIKTGHYFLF